MDAYQVNQSKTDLFPHSHSMHQKFIDMPTNNIDVHSICAFNLSFQLYPPLPHDLPQYLRLGDSHH